MIFDTTNFKNFVSKQIQNYYKIQYNKYFSKKNLSLEDVSNIPCDFVPTPVRLNDIFSIYENKFHAILLSKF